MYTMMYINVLATAFKGLTIVTFTDEKKQPQPSTSKQDKTRPFYYPSPSPLPTTTEEKAEIPELVDILLPEEVTNDNIAIEDLDWSPPPVAYRKNNRKQRYSTRFPDIEEEECCLCGQIKRKSWPGHDGKGKNNEMTDKIFKFQNIQLHLSHMRATHQNTVLQTGGTAEEQFAQIQASSRQHALNDIREHKQPTALDQIDLQDVSSSSTEEQAPSVDTVVTTSTSSFEIVHQDNNTQIVSHMPRIPDQHLQVPIDPQNIQDIWSDDDEGKHHCYKVRYVCS